MKNIVFLLLGCFLVVSCKSAFKNSKNPELTTGYIFKLYHISDNAIDGSESFWFATQEEIDSTKSKSAPEAGFSNLALSGIYHALFCCEDAKYNDVDKQREVYSMYTYDQESITALDESQSHAVFEIDRNETLSIYKVKINHCTCTKEFSSYSNEVLANDKFLYVYQIEYLKLSEGERNYLSNNWRYILSKLK